MSDSEKIRSKMLKLLALARQGVGGEKENAHRFLSSMLKKHGMTIEDLDDAFETRTLCYFKYQNNFEKQLIEAIFFKVRNIKALVVVAPKNRKLMGTELTRAEQLEVEICASIYKRELKKHLERLMQAFLIKNQIHSTVASDASENHPKMDQEEINSIVAMMSGIDRTTISRQISNGTNGN